MKRYTIIKMLTILSTLLMLHPLLGAASPSVDRGLEKREFINYTYQEGEPKPHHCVLKAVGGSEDDSDNVAAAVGMCGTDGIIELRDDI
jgi:hypothetical protein